MGVKLAIAFVLWMAFAFSFLHSITVTAAWWKDELAVGWWEGLWIGLLPVWVFVYFRYYSIFRPGCSACVTPKNPPATGHDAPRGTG